MTGNNLSFILLQNIAYFGRMNLRMYTVGITGISIALNQRNMTTAAESDITAVQHTNQGNQYNNN